MSDGFWSAFWFGLCLGFFVVVVIVLFWKEFFCVLFVVCVLLVLGGFLGGSYIFF